MDNQAGCAEQALEYNLFRFQVITQAFRRLDQLIGVPYGIEPCRRREREAIYRNSKETCGMDSTVR